MLAEALPGDVGVYDVLLEDILPQDAAADGAADGKQRDEMSLAEDAAVATLNGLVDELHGPFIGELVSAALPME